MPDLDVLIGLVLRSGTVACGGIVVLGVVGLIFALSRGKSFFRALQFGVAVVMLSLLLPAAMGVGAYVAYNATSTFMANAQETTGEVVRLVEEPTQEGGFAYSTVVKFTPLNSESSIEFDDPGAICNPPCHEVGQAVTVLYDPANPTTATIKNIITNWIWVGVFGLLGLVFLVLALLYIRDSYRKDRYWRVLVGLADAATG